MNEYLTFTLDIVDRPFGFFVYVCEEGCNPVELYRSTSKSKVIERYLLMQTMLLKGGYWEITECDSVSVYITEQSCTFRLKAGIDLYKIEPDYKW